MNAINPDSEEPVSFETHIKTMFREPDRRSMEFAFDLWSRDDVSEHADAILDRIKRATCPATARGLRYRSTSSSAGSQAANRADPRLIAVPSWGVGKHREPLRFPTVWAPDTVDPGIT